MTKQDPKKCKHIFGVNRGYDPWEDDDHDTENSNPDELYAFCPRCGTEITNGLIQEAKRREEERARKEQEESELRDKAFLDSLSSEQRAKELANREERKERMRLLTDFSRKVYGNSLVDQMANSVKVYNLLNKNDQR